MTNELIEASDELARHVDAQLMYMDLCGEKGDLERNMRYSLSAYRSARESAGEVDIVDRVLDATHDYLTKAYGSSPLAHPVDRKRIRSALA